MALGHGFDKSIPALAILAPSIALLFVNNAFIYTLTAMNRQLDFTRLSIATLAVNLVLNVALIPPFGYLGAATASTLTELALFAGGWWLLFRRGIRLRPLKTIGRPLLSAAAMAAVVYLIRGWPLLLVAITGAAVYIAALFLLRAIDPEERAILRASLSGR